MHRTERGCEPVKAGNDYCPSETTAKHHPTSGAVLLEGVGYLIGDISCQFNARSGYLRCAVNPQGPCQVAATMTRWKSLEAKKRLRLDIKYRHAVGKQAG